MTVHKFSRINSKPECDCKNDQELYCKTKQFSRLFLFGSVFLFLSALLIGVAVGILYACSSSGSSIPAAIPLSSRRWELNSDVEQEVVNEIKAENIRTNLKIITSKPHLAGSEQDEEFVVGFVKERFQSYLDAVEVFPYDVLLSFPNDTDKNYVAIVDQNGIETRKSNPVEKPVTEFEQNAAVVSAFNAYAPAGDAEGNMFYVNYGREKDFVEITSLGYNLNGSICIVRYGEVFRGDKLKYAAIYNCSALVIYSDPLEYANVSLHGWDPNTKNDVYPDTWWLPPSGFQRGSVQVRNGDPLTPDYPALNITHRESLNDIDLPPIPVLPISYEDAYQYLSILGGSAAPDDWQGGLNLTYRFGGSFGGSHVNSKALVHVANYMERKTIHTVIGYIRGWLEPDRYVIMGNHRDAWTFGGADPNSGTAIMLEMSRAIAKIVHEGKWRPRRTLMFCSWGAEESAIIGSTEWVEQMEKRLMMQAVSYLNIDVAVGGNDTFQSLSTPSLNQLLYDITKTVKNPSSAEIAQGRATVYDTWLHNLPDPNEPTVPQISSIGSGSDFTAFLQTSGVACFDITYVYVPGYPSYHSLHDTFEYLDNFMDRGFNVSVAIASVAATALMRLSGSIVLPMNSVDTALKLSAMATNLQNTYSNIFNEQNVSLSELHRVIDVFKNSADKLMQHVAKINSSTSDIQLRMINDKLFYINRGFLDFKGLPGQRFYRNVVFAPSSHNNYYGAGFPAVNDAALEAERDGSFDNVRKSLSILCLKILSAAQLMEDF